jgi:hypothetical protein
VNVTPIHNWKKAPRGYFHHFHQRWAVEICDRLNGGLLPKGVFALIEQYSSAAYPDVLALRDWPDHERERFGDQQGGVAVATEPPKTRFVSHAAEEAVYAAKANVVAIHRGDDIIAVIEIVSPGNKSGVKALRHFVEKSADYLERGVHLLVVDLFPPSSRDPQGIHGAIWEYVSDDSFVLPAEKPLTLVAYVEAELNTAYVEPVAAGDILPEMPVFLDTGTYVRVPLGKTYDATWKLCPEVFRQRVTGAA